MNVSLTDHLEAFVNSQVDTGRFASASEVVREALRLLERDNHRRLIEKWLYEGDLSDADKAALPEGALDKATTWLNALIEEGEADLREGRVVDGPTAMREMREKLERYRRRSA
jgi:antitoxin ParD1/3/4